MDLAAITQLVGTLGFPIVACSALFIQMNKQAEQHKQEMDAVKDALNNNTLVLQKLVDKLGEEDLT